MINSITVYACAKINLFLNVLSRLPDGYHTVDNVMQAVSLHDTLILTPAAKGISLECSDPSLSIPEDNLTFKAASLFFKRKVQTGGISIQLKKNIPVAAGLAGGSSDAAAVLVGMNLLFGTKMSEEELCALGAEIGMDVPFCVTGGCRRAKGRGEILSALAPMPKCLILIAIGSERISTAWAYGQIDSLPLRPEIPNGIPDALDSGDLSLVCRGMYNCFENITSIPDEIKRIMLENGASAAMMSGSGPSAFGIFPPEDRHNLDTARMKLAAKEYSTYVCEPVE